MRANHTGWGKEPDMYIGIGTVVLILLIILLVTAL
jgi:hypothetical protein